jgi:hypothetical protein
MINLEYLEQLITSMGEAVLLLNKKNGAEKEKIKTFILSITREINKIIVGELQ